MSGMDYIWNISCQLLHIRVSLPLSIPLSLSLPPHAASSTTRTTLSSDSTLSFFRAQYKEHYFSSFPHSVLELSSNRFNHYFFIVPRDLSLNTSSKRCHCICLLACLPCYTVKTSRKGTTLISIYPQDLI